MEFPSRGRFASLSLLVPKWAVFAAIPLISFAAMAAKGTDRPIAPKPPSDPLLNLDLGNSLPHYGSAATGDGPTDYWNYSYAPYQTYAEVLDLKWSTGDASNISVTVENAPGLWSSGHPDVMMDSFVHSFSGQPVVVTFSDLPNGTYDVYVYAHGVVDPQNATITANSGGATYGPESTTSGSSWLSGTWTEGDQYVLLEGVSVVGGNTLVISAAPAASPDYAFLNGIQLRQTSTHAKKAKVAKAPKPPKNALLNVDVANAVPWNGVAATGDSPNDYWNASFAPYQYFTELFDLKWSNGDLSSVTATIENGPGTWGNDHPNPMMYGYIYTYGSDTITVTLSDLPNGTYDLYVYAHGGPPDNQNGIVSAEADGITYGPEATTTDSSWLSVTWTEGSQYVLLKDVSVSAGSPLVIRSSPGDSGYAFLNGFQIRQTSKHAKKPKSEIAPKPPKKALMNLDLGSATAWAGTAATGNGPSDYWNYSYAPYQYFAELFDLQWSTGEPSNVSATVENAPGLWNAGHSNGMMDTFVHSFWGLPVLLTFNDLPNGTYDVYVYAHGVLNEQNSRISAQADGITYGPETTTTSDSWLSPSWIEGSQYVLLEGVSVLAGSPLVIQVAPAAMPDYAFVNGVQLRQTSTHVKKPKTAKAPKVPKNALLNIDVANSVSWAGAAATGDGPSDYWNPSFAPYQYFVELPNLNWSTGEASGVTATIENGPGTWGNDHPNPMMYGYIYTYGSDTITVTLTGLPKGTYSAYVYAHGGPPDDQNGVVSAEARGLVYGPEETTTSSSWLSPVWTEGAQYVLLPGISVGDGDALVIRSTPGVSGYAFLNGLQIRRTAQK